MLNREKSNRKIKDLFMKNPFILGFIYLFYTLLIGLLSGSDYQYLISPLVTPLTLIIGLIVWQWQENVKNSTARIEMNKKKYNEKAEGIFAIYTKYEKAIQNINRLFTELRSVVGQNPQRKISKSKEIALVMSKISSQVRLVDEIQIDLYNDVILFYYFKSNMNNFGESEKNIYLQANELINNLKDYKYISEKTSNFVDTYLHDEQSQPNKDINLITEYFKLLPTFQAFNFGSPDDEKVIIFTEPRKKFLELTKAI